MSERKQQIDKVNEARLSEASSDELTTKWNVRYRYSQNQSSNPPTACAVLIEQAGLLPSQGDALDLAAGRGGNARFLDHLGLTVSAWDLSSIAMEELAKDVPSINALVRDVIKQPPEPASFDVIVVSRFLHRALCPAIASALRPNGLLFYQTFHHGLSNPDFLLKPNELPVLFPSLNIEFYAEPKTSAEALLVAKRLV